MNINFQTKGDKIWIITTDMELAPVPRCCYVGNRMTRLDQILNAKKIGVSRIEHADYEQSVNDGRLVIEPCPFTRHDFDAAELMFGLCINVWNMTMDKWKQEIWNQYRNGNKKNKLVINLHRTVDNIFIV